MVTARAKRERGMTLVEIMVTLIISSIIAASTFMFFAGQQRIYETQTKILNIQQNLWAAMEIVSRYTRAAGSGMYGCVRPASYANAAAQDGSRIQSTNPSPGPFDPDPSHNKLDLAVAPPTGLRAYNRDTGDRQWIPPLWIVNNSQNDTALHVPPRTDILTVAFGNRTSGTDTDAALALNFATTDASISLTGTGTSDMFRPWEFVLMLVTPDWGYGTDPVTDRGCTTFQITNIPQADPRNILDHAGNSPAPSPPGSIPWNPPANVGTMLPPGGYTGGSAGVRNFGALTWVSFFIQQVGNGVPMLMMRQWQLADAGTGEPLTQILAEGIEDLQVSYACDTGTILAHNLMAINGQLDEGTNDASRLTDEWWNNVPGDVLPPMGDPGFCNLPTAVRITLVARTLAPDDLIDPVATGNGPLDIEDHRYTSPRPTDQFRRRVLTTTVFPRNNKPL
jgi:prepilin-type N-terminal cleavage/methylation domain-containing protein